MMIYKLNDYIEKFPVNTFYNNTKLNILTLRTLIFIVQPCRDVL